jgi:cytoskeleton protein RodZ
MNDTETMAPGAQLAAARELKLSTWQIEALEAGEFDRFPGPVFVRGFIRNYARLVRLDPDALAHLVGASLPQQAPRPETPPSQDIPFPSARRRRWRGYVAVAALLVAALAAYEFYPVEPEPLVTARPVAVTPEAAPEVAMAGPQLIEVPPAVVLFETARSFDGQPEWPVATSVPEKAPERHPAATGSGMSNEAAVSAEADRAAPFEHGDSRTREIAFVFEEESWVEVRDRSGKVIFSRLNPAGTRQVVSGEPPLSLVVGNAPGVRLAFDAQPVDLAPHTRVDVARLRLE